MTKLVMNGATLKCSEGSAEASLTVTCHDTDEDGQPVATIDDHQPMTNIAPFGMCKTTSNPDVAAATSAAQGVLTPQPCVPVIPDPWSPGSSIVTIQGVKALTADCTCQCAYTGTIEITDPAATVEADD